MSQSLANELVPSLFRTMCPLNYNLVWCPPALACVNVDALYVCSKSLGAPSFSRTPRLAATYKETGLLQLDLLGNLLVMNSGSRLPLMWGIKATAEERTSAPLSWSELILVTTLWCNKLFCWTVKNSLRNGPHARTRAHKRPLNEMTEKRLQAAANITSQVPNFYECTPKIRNILVE